MGDDDYRSQVRAHLQVREPRAVREGGRPRENEDILDEGTLYAARFDADGSGASGSPLVHGENGLSADNGFRLAGRGADRHPHRRRRRRARPTWIGRSGWRCIRAPARSYCTLSNNTSRGTGKPLHRAESLGADAANPRAPNLMGHIIRWREQGDDPAATRFRWDIFLAGGRSRARRRRSSGATSRPAVAFAQPDGLFFDPRGVLWIQTDSSAQNMVERRLGPHRQQPDAGRRPRHRRGAAFPHRTGRLRDHRRRSSRPTSARCSSTSSTPVRRPGPPRSQRSGHAPRPSAPGPTVPPPVARARRRSPSAARTAA